MGYTSVFVDTDSEDWQQPGASKIIKWATPKSGKGASELLFRPDFGGLARHRVADRIVKVFNARAVTIYLWHEVALMTSVPLIDLMWNVPAFERDLPLDSMWFQFTIAWVLIAAAVALFGWVEDIAAKRGPRLLP